MNDYSVIQSCSEAISGMRGLMQERSAEAERNRQVNRETIRELSQTGLFRVFQPQRFGGSELSMADVLPLITQTAQACSSTAWVMAVLQIHSWMMGLSPDQAQEEVFADDPETLVCGVMQPKGVARRVAGGFELQACSWPYASGCDFASWVHLLADWL